MKDEDKTKEQLIGELEETRHNYAEYGFISFKPTLRHKGRYPEPPSFHISFGMEIKYVHAWPSL